MATEKILLGNIKGPKGDQGDRGPIGSPIVKDASGEVISITGSSDVELVDLKLFGKTTQTTTTGKNLLDESTLTKQLIDESGNVSDNNDMRLTGFIPINGSMTISCVSGGNNVYVRYAKYDTDKNFLSREVCAGVLGTGAQTFSHSGYVRLCYEMIDQKHMQLEIGSVATAYEPYTGGKPSPSPDHPQELVSVGDGGTVNTTVAGKNLAPPLTVGKGLGLTTGKVITAANQAITEMIPVPANFTCIWRNIVSDIVSGVLFYNEAKEYMGRSIVTSRGDMVITPAQIEKDLTGIGGNVSYIRLYQCKNAENTGTIETLHTQLPMLHLIGTEKSYEPYTPVQTLTAQTPNGLPGIPVTSGGNYTDASGQRWVCDEVDFARGVYVQNIQRHTFDGDEDWKRLSSTLANRFYIKIGEIGAGVWGAVLCNKLPYSVVTDSTDSVVGIRPVNSTARGGLCIYVHIPEECGDMSTSSAFKAWLAENPLDVMTALTSPIETALSAEEIAAFKSLHTNKPNTTVYNDGGAGMEMEYIADTKIYIDNKFTALQNAILATGANI